MKYLVILAIILQSSCTVTGNAAIPQEEHFNYTILFCDREKCFNALLNLINNSEKVYCALYNLDQSVVDIMKNGEIITDDNSKINSGIIFKKKSAGLMHNKFCVFNDEIVWTGSFNPVKTNKDILDDVIIINSTTLASNYLEEFEELKSNSSSKTTTTKIALNTTLIENYFCPEDGCINILQSRLAEAERSIYFVTFSFTHPKIANELIIRNSVGVNIRGIMEKGGKYSQFQTLKLNNLDVVEDKSKAIFHHKLFVIDEKTVITGSFNPTRNGNMRNDENMLILHDEELAQVYLSYIRNFLG